MKSYRRLIGAWYEWEGRGHDPTGGFARLNGTFLAVSPLEVVRNADATFNVEFTNHGGAAVDVDGGIFIYYLGENGRGFWLMRLPLEERTVAPGAVYTWTVAEPLTLIPGSYEATARLSYGDTINDKVIPFAILPSGTGTFTGIVTSAVTGDFVAGATVEAIDTVSNLVIATDTTDAAGNDSAWSAAITVIKDTVAPLITIDAVTTPTSVAAQNITGTMEAGAAVVITGVTIGTVIYPTPFTWSADVTLADGSNTITATATDGAGNTAYTTTTIVLDTAVPTVGITISPELAGGRVFVDNPHFTIVYNETVTVTAATIGTLDVIGDLLTNDDLTFGLPTTGLAEGDHTVTIIAADAAGNEVTGTLSFTVCLTAEIPLHVGWNLISLPLMIDPTPPADLLAGILGNVTSVWHFDAAEGAWKSFSPTAGGDLAYMDDGMAFWIEMSAPAALTITGPEVIRAPGPQPMPTISVFEGWNMVGFTSRTPMPSAEYFVGLDVLVAWGFDPIQGWVENPINLVPGRGYWIRVGADGAITLSEDTLNW